MGRFRDWLEAPLNAPAPEQPPPADRLARVTRGRMASIREAQAEMEAEAAERAGALPAFDLGARCPHCLACGDVEHHHLTGSRDDPQHGPVIGRSCWECGHTWDEAVR